MTLPDTNVLEKRWNELRQQPEYSYLPELKIYQSAGIAPPEEFIDAICNYPILMSTEIEHVHDQLLHAVPTLIYMADHPKEHEAFKVAVKSLMETVLYQIKETKSPDDPEMKRIALIFMEHALSIFADTISATADTLLIESTRLKENVFSDFVDSGGTSLISDLNWSRYLWNNIGPDLQKLGMSYNVYSKRIDNFPYEEYRAFFKAIMGDKLEIIQKELRAALPPKPLENRDKISSESSESPASSSAASSSGPPPVTSRDYRKPSVGQIEDDFETDSDDDY